MVDVDTGRAYAGESLVERNLRRRGQLLDAGLEVFGTKGYHRATVRTLCRTAHIADRQFYAQFKSTEDLLLAVYNRCLDYLEATVLAALEGHDSDVDTLAEVGLDAFFECVQQDPRLARVVWFEVLGVSPQVDAAYMARTLAFGELLIKVSEDRDLEQSAVGAERQVIANALVGAISQTVLNWVYSDFDLPRHALVQPLVGLLRASTQAQPATPSS